MSNAFPLEELKTLLKKAKAADPSLKKFGADHHKYKWNPPATLEDVEKFEQEIGVTLPDGYRNFFLQAGDGGAGPSYGLFSLKQVRHWLTWEVQPEKMPYLSPEIETVDIEKVPDCWRGCIPIGSQGDTYFTYLFVTGPNRGRVVYVESEGLWIFFPKEPDFLSWYTRWLREVAYHYHIFWFGTNLDGDEAELCQSYTKATTKKEKIQILSSMNKFPSLQENSTALIKEASKDYIQEADIKWLMQLLHRISPKQMYAFLELRWEAGMYDAVISEIYYSIHFLHDREEKVLKRWWKRILDYLPQISQTHWHTAFQMLTSCPKVKLSDVTDLWDIAEQNSKPELIRAFGRFPDAAEHLDFFLKLLEERKDLQLLNAVCLAVPIVKNKALFSALERICEEFAFSVTPISSTDSYDKNILAKSADRHMAYMVYHSADIILEQVREEFINPKISNIPRPHRLLLQVGDRQKLMTKSSHTADEIAIHPLIPLVLQETFGYLPSTSYDWEELFLKIKTLNLKPEKRYIRSGGSTHWIYIVPPEPYSTLPNPYYYDIHDWSIIGRMRHLQILRIERICVDDFSFLTQCKALETLSLYNTNFSDCRLLCKMPNLKKIDLRQCQLTNTEILKDLHVNCIK